MKNTNFYLMSFYYNWKGDTDFSWCKTVQYTFLLKKSTGCELSDSFNDAANCYDYTVVVIDEYVSMEHGWNDCNG
jgi:hypothetical protein